MTELTGQVCWHWHKKSKIAKGFDRRGRPVCGLHLAVDQRHQYEDECADKVRARARLFKEMTANTLDPFGVVVQNYDADASTVTITWSDVLNLVSRVPK